MMTEPSSPALIAIWRAGQESALDGAKLLNVGASHY
jgi:hypothetical protein